MSDYNQGYNDGFQQGMREAREQCALEQRYLRSQLDNLIRVWTEYEARTLRPIVLPVEALIRKEAP